MATGIEAQTLEPVSPSEPEANKLFRMVMKHKGSDLHLKVGLPPAMRLTGVIRSMALPPLTTADMERLMFPLLTTRQRAILEDEGGVDFAHVVVDPDGRETRFRVNLFRQRGKLSLVARRVNNTVPDFEGLGLPPVLAEIASHDQGIVILAGVTGSGKSTTIASMLQYVNQRERCNIVTIEDPIEFTFVDEKSIIHQREVGIDVIDWDTALKHAVRQDPDIILVGEMRDRDTFNAAMHAAETGHLVFGTIHASSAPSTIGRILDLFPRDMHSALRQSLAFNLKAIIAQKLLPTAKDWAEKTGQTRIPTCEIMRTNPTVRKLILNEEDGKLGDAIRIGKEDGMQDFTESLKQLVQAEKIERSTAFEVAPSPEALKMALKGITIAQPGIL
ncbi:type IV pilus twitching motility protein PilT [Tautonia sociabilis]|uniref:PilT/PilU family type 4a pilus ATPase n=1 Tax=Tautonia sociabilis TaxID=2080755 RepID=A0A432MRZ5_9BACT|nr:PilT/PilU family type 4a pilus ATPase [Tautonia sociabilis]RUL89715.1 PilT/PilU family type 4a pilus ATPase [Tautonia sociabilis]